MRQTVRGSVVFQFVVQLKHCLTASFQMGKDSILIKNVSART